MDHSKTQHACQSVVDTHESAAHSRVTPHVLFSRTSQMIRLVSPTKSKLSASSTEFAGSR